MIREPGTGERISATWASELVREIRRNRPLAGANVRLTVTPNGTIVNGTPGGDDSTTAADRSPFSIKRSSHQGEGNSYAVGLYLQYPFYRVAGRTFRLDANADDEYPVTVDEGGFAALQISLSGSTPAATLTSFADFNALQSAELDLTTVILPLYHVTDNHLVDMRGTPTSASMEFIPT